MHEITEQIRDKLVEKGCEGVYTAFDALPIEKKGSFFTVVSCDKYEAQPIVYHNFYTLEPYKAEVGIRLTAPKDCSLIELYEYYSSGVRTALDSMLSLNFIVRSTAVDIDRKTNRLVLTVKTELSGYHKIDRRTLT